MEFSVKLKSARLLKSKEPKSFSGEKGESLLLYPVIGETSIVYREKELLIPEGHICVIYRGEVLQSIRTGTLIMLSFVLSGEAPSEIFGLPVRPNEREKRQLGEILRELEGGYRAWDISGSERIIENSVSTLWSCLAEAARSK